MKKSSRINVIESTGEDLKISLNDLIFIIRELRNDVDVLKSWKKKMAPLE